MGLLSALLRRGAGAEARAAKKQLMIALSDLPERGSGWVDQAKVSGYGDMLWTSEPPPILVARRPGGGAWEILDGHHRAAMMRASNRKEIPAIDVSERVRW